MKKRVEEKKKKSGNTKNVKKRVSATPTKLPKNVLIGLGIFFFLEKKGVP